MRAPPPLNVGVFSWFLIHLALVVLTFCLKQKKIKKIKTYEFEPSTGHNVKPPKSKPLAMNPCGLLTWTAIV